jgi:hypothetical protein
VSMCMGGAVEYSEAATGSSYACCCPIDRAA